MIEIQDLCKTYFRAGTPIRALDQVSFGIKQGELVAIVGRSGSGKSTLLNMVGGLDTATSGHILCHGKDVVALSHHELADYRKKTVGIIFQSFHLIPSRSALENVSLALAFANVPKRQRKERAIEVLEQVGLSHRLDHQPRELSGGEAQRVAIARALANNPEILLADEPTGNLDSQTAEEIGALLKELNHKGATILMVTHDAELAGQIAHKTISFSDGKIQQIKIKE